MKAPRMLCWFSNGAASAVATKLAIEHHSATHDVIPVCCDTRPSEHSDNYRFSADCEKWFGRPIVFIKSKKYATVDESFGIGDKLHYMSGPRGAICTTELKKIPRLEFAHADDVHVFGFTACEPKRISNFRERNPDMRLKFVLQDCGVTKSMCLYRLSEAGIKLPAMYEIFDEGDRALYKQNGFDNNNCPGCVKSSSPWYWSMIRKYFPETFARRAKQSREIGCRLVEIKSHQRIFLDELPDRIFKKRKKKENLSCGPECGGPAK